MRTGLVLEPGDRKRQKEEKKGKRIKDNKATKSWGGRRGESTATGATKNCIETPRQKARKKKLRMTKAAFSFFVTAVEIKNRKIKRKSISVAASSSAMAYIYIYIYSVSWLFSFFFFFCFYSTLEH